MKILQNIQKNLAEQKKENFIVHQVQSQILILIIIIIYITMKIQEFQEITTV